MPTKNDGYLIVASKKYTFYAWAINLAEGIKDFYPEAQICLVTEERFLDGREKIADHIVFCDDNVRAKLWGMSQTPFDRTFYIDADCEILHEDIANVFDELGDNDMMFTGLPEDRWYIFNDDPFPGGTFKLCGGVCLYRKTDRVIKFMKDWYDLYNLHRVGKWWPEDENGNPDYINFPQRLQQWDQFSLMWLTAHTDEFSDLKVEIFEDDLRWNYWAILCQVRHPMADNTVVYHLSCAADRDSLE